MVLLSNKPFFAGLHLFPVYEKLMKVFCAIHQTFCDKYSTENRVPVRQCISQKRLGSCSDWKSVIWAVFYGKQVVGWRPKSSVVWSVGFFKTLDFKPFDFEAFHFEPFHFETFDFEPFNFKPFDFEPCDSELFDFEPFDCETFNFKTLNF